MKDRERALANDHQGVLSPQNGNLGNLKRCLFGVTFWRKCSYFPSLLCWFVIFSKNVLAIDIIFSKSSFWTVNNHTYFNIHFNSGLTWTEAKLWAEQQGGFANNK
jgi:hypothetical protein